MPETALPGYERLAGAEGAGVLHAPGLGERGREVLGYLETGMRELPEVLGEPGPDHLAALLVAERDWREAPRENSRPYPPGLPYSTRASGEPTLVLPERLSPEIRPRTGATLPLVVWHEEAHAFLLERELVKTPAWLRELIPQAASAAVARRAGLPLGEHLAEIDPDPDFTVRGFRGPAGAEEQMAFQNLLLSLGAAALAGFREGFLGRLVGTLREEIDLVGEHRAEELLAASLGVGGRGWLSGRPEYAGAGA
ncbi:MAG: hypothetical protein H0V53_09920 [Rubrobacter sp.]|nr:hypothetical protein [Rubrobacter sp.]